MEIPIFLRQARADCQIAKYKIEQNQFDADYKQQELHAKITACKNEVLSYQSQISLMQNNIENYKRLLNAEEIRFSNGESLLFLINTRENKLLEAEQKLLDLRLKFINSFNHLKWFNENFEGYSYKDVDTCVWQNNKMYRSLVLNKILKQKKEIGFSKKELENKYGPANNIYSSGAWSYDVPKLWLRKKKYVLNFYFDLEDKVFQIRRKYRVRY